MQKHLCNTPQWVAMVAFFYSQALHLLYSPRLSTVLAHTGSKNNIWDSSCWLPIVMVINCAFIRRIGVGIYSILGLFSGYLGLPNTSAWEKTWPLPRPVFPFDYHNGSKKYCSFIWKSITKVCHKWVVYIHKQMCLWIDSIAFLHWA